MGMAASQARYLALTARKTNTEYEGQQINQARTALANQSANLFNRLLDLEVPVAPKTTDYTEIQYSFSDGTNESVLESWQQLSTADPNYNYIVNHYYYADVFTGAKKLMENPQVTSQIGLKQENVNNREPAPTVEYQYGANGEVLSVRVSGSDGVKTYDANYLPIASLPESEDLTKAVKDLSDAKASAYQDGVLPTDDVYGWQDPDTGTWHFMLKNDIAESKPIDYSTSEIPTYLGNCELKELGALTEDQAAELAQIIKDCPDSALNRYLEYDPNKGLTYDGEGVYTFELHGKTYFAAETDLINSIQRYDQYDKPIENQARLPYYNASYIKTKIEETNHALLETDSNGRFTSVKFDDDSIVYSLNTETVTNEAAYQDAMNEYNYKVQQYEKTIADINARTSIIQEQDRTLELRLKQLDTEQNALATEMDAVKKVIKDNVEKTFKTFSD